MFVHRLSEPLNVLAPFKGAHTLKCEIRQMPSTRSGASEAAEGEDDLVGADVLEEAARQLAAEGAARKAAEGRVAELQRQLAEREAAEASFRSAEGGGPEVE